MFGSAKYRRFLQHPGYNDPVTAITAAVSIGSSVMQSKAQGKAADAQRESQQAQQRSASANAQRERIKAMREARIRAAQIEASAGAAGMGQLSSGVAGSIASIGSQAGANIGQINVQEGFAEEASLANQRAANAMADAAQWQAIGGIATNIFNQASASLFKKPGTQAGDVGKNAISKTTV